jgi:hypothetical protein
MGGVGISLESFSLEARQYLDRTHVMDPRYFDYTYKDFAIIAGLKLF